MGVSAASDVVPIRGRGPTGQTRLPTERSATAGTIREARIDNRLIGEATVAGSFSDIGHSESLAQLRRDLVGRLLHYHLPDLDGAAIRLSAPRQLTQEITRYVYEQTSEAGQRAFAGISYLLRLGDELRNWAIFEPATEAEALATAGAVKVSAIAPDDPDLLHALRIHGLELVGA